MRTDSSAGQAQAEAAASRHTPQSSLQGHRGMWNSYFSQAAGDLTFIRGLFRRHFFDRQCQRSRC